MTSVTEKVAEKIGSIGPVVHDRVVDVMVERQVKKRADALVIVLDKLDQMKKDLNKIRPDQVQFDRTGKEIDASFSKAKITEIQKLEKAVQKFEGALNKALEKNDYGDVFNLAAGKSPNEDKGGDGEKTDTDTD